MLHSKIKELKLRVGQNPISYSNVKFDHRAKVGTDSRLIKAYHAVWGVPDDYGTVAVKGCFSKSIQERGPQSMAKQKILTLYMHDQSDPLCVPKVLVEDDYGLYAEWEPDEVPSGDRTVMQVRSGTINQFSYGFNYVWDKMTYDEKTGLVYMNECELYEISPVSFGSNRETFAVRSVEELEKDFIDLQEETEYFIKSIPRKQQLELRQLITRHISLSKVEPLELRQKALENKEPVESGLNYNELLNELKLLRK